MFNVVDNKDAKAAGGNPCLEQTLESYELCCLVETYPGNHDTIEEWHETLKYAFLYAKSVTLVMTHTAKTNEVIARNRRIGASMSGIVQAFKKFVIKRLVEQPFRWGWQQTGARRDILGANEKVVKIKGEDVLWGELGFEQMTSILEHCFVDPPDLTLAQIGELRLAVAVFWQEQARIPDAKREGDEAVKLVPALAGARKALFDNYRSLNRE